MFRGIHHVAIAVRSLEATAGFYHAFGLREGRRELVAEQGVQAALFPVGGGEIELLEPVNLTGGVAKFIERRGEGLHHVCFETEGVAQALERARTEGLALIDKAPRKGLAGTIAFLHPSTTHGLLVELAQPDHGETSGELPPMRLETTYLAVKDPSAAAASYARHFDATPGHPTQDPCLGVTALPVAIGTGQLTLLPAADLAEADGPFHGCGEGLLGLCLGVQDLSGTLGRLQEQGIRVDVWGEEAGKRVGRVDASRTAGVALLLCQAGAERQ
jgi:methylmalonyl-CoA/ethylmalonyl-CoA epimerase